MTEEEKTQSTETADPDSAESENRFHTYEGTRVPWYVHLLWVGFWVLAIAYTLNFLFPELQTELFNPP